MDFFFVLGPSVESFHSFVSSNSIFKSGIILLYTLFVARSDKPRTSLRTNFYVQSMHEV